MKTCLELMKDETALNALHGMIDHCMQRKGSSYHAEGSESGTMQKEDKQRVQTKCADWGI
jgi:hypothetical protein